MKGDNKRVFLLKEFGLNDIDRRFHDIGVHPVGIEIMKDKFKFFVFYITDLSPVECNILKQEALACGAEAAVPKAAVECKIRSCNVLISGTKKELKMLSDKLKLEPCNLKEIGTRILDTISEVKRPILRISKNKVIRFDDRPIIMGILNVTPDSFSDGGMYFNREDAIRHGLKLVEDGADIIDIGGESTRPGSLGISVKEETERVIPVIKSLTRKIKVPLSIDTTKSEVAKAAVDNGATIINDISGLRFDKRIAKVAAEYDCGLILMHTRGRPKVMQKGEIYYKDLVLDITKYLEESINIALDAGVKFENIAIDPGIGFGKRAEHNIQIISNLLAFRSLKRPVLVGASRKSFLGHITSREVYEREDASTAVHTILTLNGVDMLRVHNVKATVDAVRVSKAIENNICKIF
ncbi:MAG: dihydropteroate synthase [Deltaproteobacteria bacterium]|nr:dihydropteroate synthase [Deltaproteobacteria bacterium]